MSHRSLVGVPTAVSGSARGTGLRVGVVFRLGASVRKTRFVTWPIEVIGIKWNVEYGPPRPGDVRDSLADISAANQAFGFEPRVPLYEGLVEYVEWAKSVVGT